MAESDNTIEALRGYVGTFPSQFATSPVSREIIRSSTEDGVDAATSMTYQKGIPDIYAKPTGDGGKLVTRQMFNSLGNIGSQLGFFEQCGGYFTFDEAVSAAIGGYPMDAVLSFYDEKTKLLRRVRSLKDDNTWNFLTRGVDGVHWAYADDVGLLSMHVDYAHSKDIGDRLFTDSGEPEWIEIEENCILNCAAAGAIGEIEGTPLFRYNRQIGHYSSYLSETQGVSYLDVSGSGGGYRTFGIGAWNWSNHGYYKKSGTRTEWRLWIEAEITSCGACLALGAGDRIRARHQCFQSPLSPTSPVFRDFPSDAPIRYYGQKYFPPVGVADSQFPRRFLVKIAMLSPMRFKRI